MTGPVGRALAGVETDNAGKGRSGVARGPEDDGAFGRTVESLGVGQRKTEAAGGRQAKEADDLQSETQEDADMHIGARLPTDSEPSAGTKRGADQAASLLLLFRDAMRPGDAEGRPQARDAVDSVPKTERSAGRNGPESGRDGSVDEAERSDAERVLADPPKVANPAVGLAATGHGAFVDVSEASASKGADRTAATVGAVDRWIAARSQETGSPHASVAEGDGAPDDLFRFARGRSETPPPSVADAVVRSVGASVAATLEGGRTGSRTRDLTEAGEMRMAPAGDVDRLGERSERLERSELLARHVPDIAVIENRKFLGVAAGQTSTAAVVSTVTDNGEWNAMLREASATAATTLNGARNASNTLKIQLSPIELGTVTAVFRMSGGHLSIELKVETIEAYRHLADDQNGILKALKGQGVDVEHIVIQHTSGDRSMQTVSGNAPAGGNAGNGANGDASGQQSAAGQQRGEAGSDSHRRPAREQGEGDARRTERHPAGDVYL